MEGRKISAWIGFYSGPVIERTDELHESQGLGVFELSAHEAERSALWWAAAYLLQCDHRCPAFIHYDSVAAGERASGQATGSDSSQDFGVGPTIRAVCQLLEQTRHISYRHVKGHTGPAGNELADAIASATCAGTSPDSTPRCHVPAIHRASRDFMQWTFANQPAADRPIVGDHVIRFPGYEAADQLPFSWRPGDLCKPVIPCLATLHMHVISYNVMTAKKYGTIALLRRHLEDHHVHVAGFQETRDAQSKVWPGQPYFRFCSAATAQGIGGLQLWISGQLPFANCNGRKMVFHKKISQSHTIHLAS